MNFKKFLPHAYIIGGFFLIVLIYFMPLWQGKSIGQSDILQHQGMAKEIMDNRTKYGEEPFWTSSMFGGMPSTLINMDYYGNLVRPIHIFTTRVIAYPASIIFVSLLCFYIMLLAFDVPSVLAALGAIGFSFTSFNFIGLEVGHNAKLACMSYMPLVLAGLVYGYRKNLWLGCSLLGIGTALQVVNNHIQITYYLFFICLGYVVVELIDAIAKKTLPQFIKVSVALLITVLIGIGTHAGYFMSISEYSKYTIRGKTELKPLDENKEIIREDGLDRDYVFNYSNSLSEPLTYMIANYMGGASAGPLGRESNFAKALRDNGVDSQQIGQYLAGVPLYFGSQPFVAGPFYLGAIICFLFLLGMIVLEDKLKWAMLAVSIFGILLTYGKNLPIINYPIFEYFPLYNKFRSVTMAVVLPQFCMSLIAVMAIKKVIETKDKLTLLKPLAIAAGVTGGFCLLTYVMAGSGDFSSPNDKLREYPEWLISAIEADRKDMRTGDALRSFLLISFAAGMIYLYIKDKLNAKLMPVILTLVVLVDLWMVDKRYLNNDSFRKKVAENYFAATEADQMILQDTDPNYRVLKLGDPFNEARTSYYHKSIGGYSPAKLRRYQDLIERVLYVEYERMIEGLRKGNTELNNLPALNMLNMKYVIAGEDAQSVLKNVNALGNAWFVSSIVKVNSPDEEIAKLLNFDSKTTAVIDVSQFKADKTEYTLDSTSTIKLTAFKPYDLTYESNASQDGFAVFSEVYYPKGWTATIDGKEVDIQRVNYVLRGLAVPAGKHTIRFQMVNEAYTNGNTIGLICSLLLYGGLIAAVVVGLKKKEA